VWVWSVPEFGHALLAMLANQSPSAAAAGMILLHIYLLSEEAALDGVRALMLVHVMRGVGTELRSCVMLQLL